MVTGYMAELEARMTGLEARDRAQEDRYVRREAEREAFLACRRKAMDADREARRIRAWLTRAPRKRRLEDLLPAGRRVARLGKPQLKDFTAGADGPEYPPSIEDGDAAEVRAACDRILRRDFVAIRGIGGGVSRLRHRRTGMSLAAYQPKETP